MTILRKSLLEILESLRTGETTASALMETTLDSMAETHARLNAVTSTRERDVILEEAARADRKWADGTARPLEGVPLGVKDLEDVEGMVTSMGSVPYKDNVAVRDTTQVRRLGDAGAIVVAKTNTPEFGFTAITKNLLFGDTRSPWDDARSPGGSSGGSAALLAGCVLPLVTASDGGGSVRIPASFVGAFGLKPSHGRIPLGPLRAWDTSQVSVAGPLTKTVEDAAFYLDVVAGPSVDDPASLPAAGVSYLDEVRRPLEDRLRIAYSPDLGYAVVQSDIARAVEDAVETIASMGHDVTRIDGGPPDPGDNWRRSGNFLLAGTLAPHLPEHEGSITRFLMNGLRDASEMTPAQWIDGQRARAGLVDWVNGIFRDYDILLTPTVPIDPPPSRGPFPTETEGRPQTPVVGGAFTIPFNLSWNPAATVRVGFSEARLPIGLQIVGPRHRDDMVLRLSRAYEIQNPWHPAWAWQGRAASGGTAES